MPELLANHGCDFDFMGRVRIGSHDKDSPKGMEIQTLKCSVCLAFIEYGIDGTISSDFLNTTKLRHVVSRTLIKVPENAHERALGSGIAEDNQVLLRSLVL